MSLFFQSVFLGFLVALPVGPVAFLILQRTLNLGWAAGLSSGLGAAAADSVFALLASLGLAALLEQIRESRPYVASIGGFVLILVGIRLFLKKPHRLEAGEVLSERYMRHYLWDALSVFLLTLTNPMVILAFGALFAGSNLIPLDPRRIDYLVVSSGVFYGSLLWWFAIVFLAGPIRRNISLPRIQRTLQAIGLILILLGASSIVTRSGVLVDKITVPGRIPPP